MYAFLAEHRHRLFPDDLSADLFPSGRGRPSQPADLVATVLVLQSLEGLWDRDALQALAIDLRWKVAAGLAITDAGFHPTVLTLWRNKLRRSDRPERIFDAVRDVITSTNVLANKTRRALDSTLLDDAVATQDTVTQLVSMIRRVRNAIPEAAAADVVGDAVVRLARASQRAHGTTRSLATSWSRVWSMTHSACSPRSTASTSTTTSINWSGCSRWLPAKTSNPAMRGRHLAHRTQPREASGDLDGRS